MDNELYDAKTGLPKDNGYLEYGLPPFLQESIKAMDAGDPELWDCLYCELQSDINVAEVEQIITPEQAWYLREKYLGIKKEQNFDD